MSMKLSCGAVVTGAVFALTLGVRASGGAPQVAGQQPAGQQPAPAVPQGPLAPEKYKNIQVQPISSTASCASCPRRSA